MNHFAAIGRKRTVLISISILLVSIHTIYFYHSNKPEVDSAKLTQQIIRFLLTAVLLYFLFKGKNWARLVSSILFSIAILGSLIALFTLKGSFIAKTPLLVMLFVYPMAIKHFWFSREYKAFSKHQNSRR
jgi:hypothetical protein